jgi:hypothetical protein
MIQSLPARATRLATLMFAAVALAVALVLTTAGAAAADVETSCAHRNANSLKPVQSQAGRGERVKTVCPVSEASVPAPIPTSIPAGEGGLLPIAPVAVASLMGLGAISLGAGLRRGLLRV